MRFSDQRPANLLRTLLVWGQRTVIFRLVSPGRIVPARHPTGQFMATVDSHSDDGTTRYRRQEVERGDVIATGTIYADGYGATVVQRAQFIVTTIRDHLRRKACAHHLDNLGSISAVLGAAVLWYPVCGTRLPARYHSATSWRC